MSEPAAWGADHHAARRALLERLLALPAEARAAALETAAAGDAALRDDVAAMLAAAADDADDDGPPAGALGAAVERGVAAALAGAAPPPREVGSWTVLEKIAEGGMGVVWKARQQRPPRLAALKFLRLASATPDATRRLELEAEVLAHLQHPGIAQLYEVGTVAGPTGPQPYLAMEFVDGEPLDAYVARVAPPRAERLRLFLDLCAAVEHAHGQGVIHRDLKPSNVLVRRDGRLKVLDFGIARMAAPAAPGATPGTRTGAVLGTLAYMGPERLSGATADARSDVYALGAILFEILAGRLPLDLSQDPIARAVDRITHEAPPRLGALDPALAGDLETIVATALAKDPARRYATAAALADDVRRHLAHQPVRARAPSAWYVMSRFARRHRTAVALLAVAAAGLVVATALSVAAAARADRERGRAETARGLADALAERAERDAYRARLAAAGLELDAGDARAAAASLEAAPSARRGWEWDHFASRLDESRRTFGSSAEAVVDAAFAADGDHLVLVARARDGTAPSRVRTVRWRDGAVVAERATLGAAMLSADGSTVAETDDRRSARLVTVAGEEVGAFEAEGAEVAMRPAGIAPDGSGAAFVVADDVRKVRSLHVLRRGERTARRLGNSGSYAALSPGSRHVAWQGKPNTWALTDLGTGAQAWLSFGGSVVRPLAFDFDATGRRLLAATSRSWLLWDVDAPGSPQTGPEEAGALHGVAFAPDGARATFVSRNGAVRVWDLARRELVRSLGGQSEVPSGADCRVLHHASGRHFLTSDGTGYVRLWDDAAGGKSALDTAHAGFVYGAAASPDGARVATAGWDGALVLLDPLTGRVVGRHRRPEGSILLDVAWSPDGRRIAVLEAPSSGADHFVVLLDARTLVPDAPPVPVRVGMTLPFGGPFLRLMAFVPTTGALFVARTEGFVVVDRGASAARPGASAAPGAPWARRTPERTAVVAARGDLLLRLTGAGRVEVRRGPDGALARSLETGIEGGCEAVIDAALRHVYVGTLGGLLARVDLETGEVRRVPGAAAGALYAATLAEAGRRLFTGGEDGLVRVWRLPDLEPVTDLRGHRSYVHALALAAGGRVLVSGGGDNTVRLWATVPWSARAAADEAGAATRAAVAPRVEALFAAGAAAARVADTLEADPTLSRAELEAALDVVRARAASGGR